ncbi:MAG: hypothetical protein ACRDON_08675 [Gaiellaceae bacterium]
MRDSCPVALDFAAAGVLPSSHGLTYVSDTGTPEASVFSVSGGLLHMNTLGTGAVAYYQTSFDPTRAFVLAFRMKVFPGTGSFGVDFDVEDPVTQRDFEFGFEPHGITLPPSPNRDFLAVDTASRFRTYVVAVPAGSTLWRLFIDGRFAASGRVSGGDFSGVPRFLFGDGASAWDGRMDVDFVVFCQPREEADD